MNGKSYLNIVTDFDINLIVKDIAGWSEDVKLLSLAWHHEGIGAYCELYSGKTGKIIARLKQKK